MSSLHGISVQSQNVLTLNFPLLTQTTLYDNSVVSGISCGFFFSCIMVLLVAVIFSVLLHVNFPITY